MKVSRIGSILYFICMLNQTVVADENTPDMALLEFLGSFDTEDDQWLDPTLLSDVEIFDDELDKGQSDENN